MSRVLAINTVSLEFTRMSLQATFVANRISRSSSITAPFSLMRTSARVGPVHRAFERFQSIDAHETSSFEVQERSHARILQRNGS
jgi:hypothetical protein